MLDRKIEAWTTGYALMGGQTFCGKGCSGCCSLAVNCNFIEAVCIAEELTDSSSSELHKHVAKLLAAIHTVADIKSYLQLQRKVIGPCPFLDKAGYCSIYSLRPFSCRALLATKENHWCSVDFAELPTDEKLCFVESLDRSAVAFPMHYAALPQEMGRELETDAAGHMAEQYGFSLYGNLPFLVWLEIKHHLSELIPNGRESTVEFLAQRGLDNHFLIMFDPCA